MNITGWIFDDTENPDAWGHAGTCTLGFTDTLAICWDQWQNWKSDTQHDGADARSQLAGCGRMLRKVEPQDRDALDRIICEFNLLEGCDDFRGAVTHEDQSDRGADVWRAEQVLIDTGQAHREPAANCGCVDWPCCGCEGYVLAGGAA